jgi:hypothetical protein
VRALRRRHAARSRSFVAARDHHTAVLARILGIGYGLAVTPSWRRTASGRFTHIPSTCGAGRSRGSSRSSPTRPDWSCAGSYRIVAPRPPALALLVNYYVAVVTRRRVLAPVRWSMIAALNAVGLAGDRIRRLGYPKQDTLIHRFLVVCARVSDVG